MPRRSPFAATTPSILAALGYAAAIPVWVLWGRQLPGGRWLAVHLFTLGVLTNLVLAFSEHFGRTLTRQPDQQIRWQPAVTNLGVVLVLVGLPAGAAWMVAVGAGVVTGVVLVSYVRLRRMRKAALGARFVWIVRAYERAHGAFVHGAALGVLLGVGVLPAGWYVPVRIAHLHVNVLGWGGLTLLATLVFLGPTVVRTRIVEGADARAARALRYGASGLTAGVLLLLATGLGGPAALWSRLAAAAALGVFAWAATVTCLPVAAAARGARDSAGRWPVVAVSTWLPLAAWADVAIVAAGEWRLLEAAGLAVLVGALVQMIVAVLAYLAPMLRSRGSGDRDLLLARLDRLARHRAAAFNTGVAAVVLAAVAGGRGGALLGRAGWTLVGLAVLQITVSGLWPLPAQADEAAS